MASSNGSIIFRVTGPLREESTLDSPHKGQWREALMFSLISAWTNEWANNRDTGDLRRHCTHCDVIVMQCHWSEPEGYGYNWQVSQNNNTQQSANHVHEPLIYMLASSYGNAFRITGPVLGESTGQRRLPLTEGQWCRKCFNVIKKLSKWFPYILLHEVQTDCIFWHPWGKSRRVEQTPGRRTTPVPMVVAVGTKERLWGGGVHAGQSPDHFHCAWLELKKICIQISFRYTHGF